MSLINLSGLLPRAPFHFVTDFAKVFTVHSKSGLPILPKYKSENNLRAYRKQFRDGFEFFGFQLVVIHLRRFRSLEQIRAFVCTFAAHSVHFWEWASMS